MDKRLPRTNGYLAFAIGVCLTIWICVLVTNAQDARLRSNFQRDADKVANDTRVRLQTYFDMLISIKGMFAVNDSVSRQQFSRFVRELNLAERYPGFQAIQFVRHVPADQLAAFTEAVRADTTLHPEGHPAFAVHPVVAAPAHYIIEYVEPMAGNERTFGFDLAALPAQMAAVELGRDSGAIVATEPITLIQDKGRASGAGFVARTPVYRPGMPLETVEQRRAAFVGALAIVFRMENLMHEVIEPTQLGHMTVRVVDAGDGLPGKGIVLYDNARPVFDMLPKLGWTQTIEVQPRNWVMSFGAVAGSRYSRDATTVLLVAMAGTIISALVAALINASSRSRNLARRLSVTLEHQRNNMVELERQKAKVESAHGDLSIALETLQHAQSNLITSEKMASLGALVAGVAHELNTPIGNSLLTATALSDRAEEFERKYAAGGIKRSALEEHLADTKTACGIMTNSLRRAGDLITSFKQVAVDQTSDKRRRFDLCNVVRDTVAAFSAQFKRANCDARIEVCESLEMDSYPGSVGQVLSNLINNALLHAFEGRSEGTIAIAVKPVGHDEVLIEVRDNGVGMGAKVIHQVFDPFFTTKMGQGGTGLGMNIVYNIVTGMLGGTVELDSKPGQGTTVTIKVPVKAPVRAASATQSG
ncbi:MAG: CHASE domain-containing protein [Telluria sp.]